MLQKPKNINIIDIDGNNRKFTIHRVPPLVGRKISLQVIQSLLPKKFGGEYALNEELSTILLSYVTVKIGDNDSVPLDHEDMINNHVGDYQTLLKLEMNMIRYNTKIDLKEYPLFEIIFEALGMIKEKD